MTVTPVTPEWIDKIEAIDEDMELRIHCAINRDDKELVISLMRSPDFLKSNRFAHEDEIWQSICTADAVNCATSLLEGELGRWARAVDVNTPILGFGGRGAKIFPLHYAAHYACPGVINVILSRGARTDIRLYDPQNILGAGGLLPLEIALDFVRDFLSEWIVFSPGESTFFQLIASLCHPRMKFLLEACKLLALSSENVAKEAYYYATKGKLTEFAVLLMVAREKVLAPITFSRQDGDGHNGSMTLHQYLVNEIGSLFDKEWKLPGSLVKKKLTSIHGKKMVLSSAALLVEVFEKAGKAIEEYVQLEHGSEEDEQVEKDVALRLGEVGFTLKNGDFDFSIKNWMSSRNSVRTPIMPLETSSEGLSQLVHPPLSLLLVHPPLSLLQQRNYHPRIGIIPGGGYSYSSPTYPVRRTPILFSMKNSYNSPSWDVQVNKQTKTIEQGLSKFLSREKLAYISMLIRKGIRSA